MLNFDFLVPTRLIFGAETHKNVGALLRGYGVQKILLHYGGGSLKKSGLYDEVTESLKAADIAWVELGGVVPNPRLELVHEGIALARKEKIELVLAVGGGSVIDSSKAIAAGVCYDGDVWDFYEGKAYIEKKLPVATIVTIPAAGSETSKSSVITNAATQLKRGLNDEHLRPLFSIMDPTLFFTLPKNQIANGVADMISHILERYFTNTLHTDLTDELCEGTLRAILRNGPRLLEDPKDYDAWCQIGHSGSMAHTDILGLGRAQEWSCHPIEHELSALYDVAHGAGLAVITPAWMSYVYRENVPMFAHFAARVMGVDGSLRDPEDLALRGIDRLRAFFKEMRLPLTLRDLGIGEDRLEEMAKRATRAEEGREETPLGGIKPLYWRDVLEIYRRAI